MACTCATIYDAWKETKELIPRFWQNLLEYFKFINNVYRVWVPENNNLDFNAFISEMNNFGKLCRKASKLSLLQMTLDLDTWIDKEGFIKTRTF